jgi:hypothetical protein
MITRENILKGDTRVIESAHRDWYPMVRSRIMDFLNRGDPAYQEVDFINQSRFFVYLSAKNTNPGIKMSTYYFRVFSNWLNNLYNREGLRTKHSDRKRKLRVGIPEKVYSFSLDEDNDYQVEMDSIASDEIDVIGELSFKIKVLENKKLTASEKIYIQLLIQGYSLKEAQSMITKFGGKKDVNKKRFAKIRS